MSFGINPLYDEIIRAAQDAERDRYTNLRPHSYPTSRARLPGRLRALLFDRPLPIAAAPPATWSGRSRGFLSKPAASAPCAAAPC